MVRGGREVAVFLCLVLVAGFALVALAPAASAEDAPPHVAITHPAAGATVNGTVTVAGNAWDTDGSVVNVTVGIDTGERSPATDTSGNSTWWTWQWTWDTTKWANGEHHIVAVAADNASRLGDNSRLVYVQNPEDEPPVIVITHPAEGAVVNGTVTIAGNAWDADGSVVAVKVRIDLDGSVYSAEDTSGNGTWWSWSLTWDSTTVPNGEHTIFAKAIDDKEQVGWADVHVIVHNEGGNLPPWVEFTAPPQGSTVSGVVNITGEAGDHDGTVELVQVRIGDGTWHNATDTSGGGNWSTWLYLWNTTGLEAGWYHVYARSFDGHAYSGTAVLELYVTHEGGEDNPPGVAIDHPADGDNVSGVVLVYGRAWDTDPGDHVTNVWVRIDHGDWHPAHDLTDNDSWYIWGWVWDTTRVENGTHQVCAIAYDGELYADACIHVNVANTDAPPTVAIEHPEDGTQVSGVVLVHGTASDDHAVFHVQVRIDDGEWHDAVDTSGHGTWSTWAWEWDTKDYENGNHTVSARAWDGHHYSEVAHVTVDVENEHTGDFGEVLRENAPVVGGLTLLGVIGASAIYWWRRFGLLGSLR